MLSNTIKLGQNARASRSDVRAALDKRIFHLNDLLKEAIAISLLVFTGCKKFVHQNIKAASNSSLAFSTYNDVFTEINKAVSSEMALDEMANGSWNLQGSVDATVTLEPIGTSFPKTLTIDYGTESIGPDGVVRSGKIVAMFDGNFLVWFWCKFHSVLNCNFGKSGIISISNIAFEISSSVSKSKPFS